MDMTTIVGIAALAVLGVVCGALALWCEYRDGIVGHLALALCAICALVVVLEGLDADEYRLLPTSAGVFVAMAVFMLRHAWRAWRFRGNS